MAEPAKGLMAIIEKVCAARGIPVPPPPPDYEKRLPLLPIDATPAQIAAQKLAAHRLFMESVASPGPSRGNDVRYG